MVLVYKSGQKKLHNLYYQMSFTKIADDRRFHPIRDYLNALPEWDGRTRVDILLIDYSGAEDNGIGER